MAGEEKSISIGALVFPQIDQIDLTGPFEVLSRIPGATIRLLSKELRPVRDMKGLALTPDCTFDEAPRIDLLVVPGGWGQEALMEDETVLGFIRAHAAEGKMLFSVCTGALLCGAAGVLRGVRATTHWAAFHLLPYFGAIAVESRVVVDGMIVSAAGVTSGIDGALRVAALLRGDRVARAIQLGIEYAPDPPFDSGSPQTAPPDVVKAVRASFEGIAAARLATAERYASRFGIR